MTERQPKQAGPLFDDRPAQPKPIEQQTVATPALDAAIAQTEKGVVTWKARDTGEVLKFKMEDVRKLFVTPTRTGKLPTDRDCWLFLQLCKARGLNPYVSDAYLVGYDSQDGAKWTLIVSHQAVMKRAAWTKELRILQSGVIVHNKVTKDFHDIDGDFVPPGCECIGGWARAQREGMDAPFIARLNLSTYSTGRSRWKDDAPGMIVKCAEVHAVRTIFPDEVGGLYIREEMGRDDAEQKQRTGSRTSNLAAAVVAPSALPVSEVASDSDPGDTHDDGVAVGAGGEGQGPAAA